MQFPTLDQVLSELEQISEVGAIDPDAPLDDLDVDSLDLLEWLYSLEEESELAIDESVFEEMNGEMTIREIYDKIREYVTALATSA